MVTARQAAISSMQVAGQAFEVDLEQVSGEDFCRSAANCGSTSALESGR